jgi:glycosyltransferase involved in cell wall biosynthesis
VPGPADTLAVVIPAYQAAGTVRDVVGRTRATVPQALVIVVDDGSSDGTAAAAEVGGGGGATGATVVGHGGNLGKGAALRTGVAAAIARGAEVVVTLDADGQHPPEEIPRVIAPITAGRADLVLGARSRTSTMPLGRRLTNWLSASLASRVGGRGAAPVPDAQTGFRAFTRALAVRVCPRETRYDYEAAFLLAALAAGYRVVSIPVPTVYRTERSHFRHVADALRVARVFARYGRRILLGAS